MIQSDNLIERLREWALVEETEIGEPISVGPKAIAVLRQAADALSSLKAEVERLEAEADEAYEIGKRDGHSFATQCLDIHTGGDGEFRYCLGDEGSEAHCPDAGMMQMRILDRFNAANSRAESAERKAEKLREALRPFARFADAFDAKPLRMLDDEIYGIHSGTEWESSLRLSDCRAARQALGNQR